MAIEGPLKELGIHDVFQLLDLSRKTGVLRVYSDLCNNEGRVWFENGSVLFAQLRSNPHPLGELLVKAGKISEADLQRARDMQGQGDRRLIGEVLIEIGAIAGKELDRQVRFQTEEVIFEMMGWQEGNFSFEEGHDQPIPADATTHIRTEALLMEGARRIDEWSRINRKIPHTGVVPVFSASGETKEGELDLLPAVRAADAGSLILADGNSCRQQIAHGTGRTALHAARVEWRSDPELRFAALGTEPRRVRCREDFVRARERRRVDDQATEEGDTSIAGGVAGGSLLVPRSAADRREYEGFRPRTVGGRRGLGRAPAFGGVAPVAREGFAGTRGVHASRGLLSSSLASRFHVDRYASPDW